MKQWFSTPLGKQTLALEKQALKPVLSRCFGYHLLQLGCSGGPLVSDSPIGHCFSVTEHVSDGSSSILACGEALPLMSESIDLVILHHSLELAENPHQVLREVSRVLIAGGQVIICGFNPYSSWGVRKMFSFARKAPWNNRRLSTGRLTDWLKLLDFRVDDIRYGGYCLPVNSERWIRYSSIFEGYAKTLNWPTGGLYMISGRKQVAPLTLIKAKWNKFPRQVGVPASDNARRNPIQRGK